MCIAGGDKTLISLIFHANGLLKFLLFPANHYFPESFNLHSSLISDYQ